jgi:lysophospholipase L1-like esterase
MMRLSGTTLLWLLTAAWSLFSIPCQISEAAPLKVMPLGDSITAGDTDGDYRTRLWQRFSSDRTKLDFLGSQHTGPEALGDKFHEGHPGYTIAAEPAVTFGNLTDNIARWLPVGRSGIIPDVILLMIGTNDVNNVLVQTPSAPQRLSHLISLISDPMTGRSPQSKLIVSTILPIDDSNVIFRTIPNDTSRNARAMAFNAALPGIVASHRANGENVFYFDMNARFNMSDIKDGLHPSPAGYEKLGDGWYDAIQGVLIPEPSSLILVMLALLPAVGGTRWRSIKPGKKANSRPPNNVFG